MDTNHAIVSALLCCVNYWRKQNPQELWKFLWISRFITA